jgi:hypothetical protein
LLTLYVNSANNTGTVNGKTEATGYLTMQAAIDAASKGDTILVEDGKGYSEADTLDAHDDFVTIEAAK